MEVHHHPRVEKKNFKEYFLEFIMIFLAVTMGFFAENIREHFAEEKSAHQYLSNYRQELLRNKKNIENDARLINTEIPVADSLLLIYNDEKENENLLLTARLIYESLNAYMPNLETGAYQQMVNSGGLKMIEDDSLKNYLAQYIDKIERLKNFNEHISTAMFNRFPDIAKRMDIYNITENKLSDVKPFPTLTLQDRREIIAFFLDGEQLLVDAKYSLDSIQILNTKLLQIINH